MTFVGRLFLVLDWLMTIASGDVWPARSMVADSFQAYDGIADSAAVSVTDTLERQPVKSWRVPPPHTLLRGMTIDERMLVFSCALCGDGFALHEFHWYLGTRPEPPTERNVMAVRVSWS